MSAEGNDRFDLLIVRRADFESDAAFRDAYWLTYRLYGSCACPPEDHEIIWPLRLKN